MGLTLHYSGSFRPDASLPQMIEEVKDIAQVNNWEYFLFETDFPAGSRDTETFDKNLYGLCVSPPESEPVWLCFLSNGKMSNPANLQFYGDAQTKEEQESLYMNFTKTQYAGAEVHKKVVHLLKHIERKYLQNFTAFDEGKYWETGDGKLLEKTFREYEELIDNFTLGLQAIRVEEGETLEDYLVKVADRVKKARGK